MFINKKLMQYKLHNKNKNLKKMENFTIYVKIIFVK